MRLFVKFAFIDLGYISIYQNPILTMKIFSTTQVRELDRFTIDHEPIRSIDLMERAAIALYKKYVESISCDRVLILAGPGNNGGDALALARLLLDNSRKVNAVLLAEGKLSADCAINHQRLINLSPDSVTEMRTSFVAPPIEPNTLIVDGLFGSGLSRPLSGMYADAVNWINEQNCRVLSIDIPSGLQGEEIANPSHPMVKADYTLSFQFPKLAFLFRENEIYVGNWEILDIGIHPQAINTTPTPYHLLTKNNVSQLLKRRRKFSHKGTFGHLLLIAGSKGMAGASVLGARAALRCGAGLVTVQSPECNREIIQTAIPEAIFSTGETDDYLRRVPDLEKYTTIAIGPGIGTHAETADMLQLLVQQLTKACVMDADALNIISKNKKMLKQIPAGTILTPHPKEFERLFGNSGNSFEAMQKASEMAMEHQLIIILKGAHTTITLPDGRIYFNNSGNAGMATAGAGDVLTGILGSLLAQGYTPDEAALLGVYLHGCAGDKALQKQSEESLIASDMVDSIGNAFQELKGSI